MHIDLIKVPKNPPKTEPSRAQVLGVRVKGDSILIMFGSIFFGVLIGGVSLALGNIIGVTIFFTILPVPLAIFYIHRFKKNKPAHYTDFFITNYLMKGSYLMRFTKIKKNPLVETNRSN